jgi:hypothetical protein
MIAAVGVLVRMAGYANFAIIVLVAAVVATLGLRCIPVSLAVGRAENC